MSYALSKEQVIQDVDEDSDSDVPGLTSGISGGSGSDSSEAGGQPRLASDLNLNEDAPSDEDMPGLIGEPRLGCALLLPSCLLLPCVSRCRYCWADASWFDHAVGDGGVGTARLNGWFG